MLLNSASPLIREFFFNIVPVFSFYKILKSIKYSKSQSEITVCGTERTRDLNPDFIQTALASCPLVSHLSIPLFCVVFNGSKVDLQYCVSFKAYSKVLQLNFFRLYSIIGLYMILNIILWYIVNPCSLSILCIVACID